MKKLSKKLNPAGIIVFILFVLLIISPSVSIEYMKNSLKLCVSTLVPSLFPFAVISDFLVSSNSTGLLKSTLGRFFSCIFGVSREGALAVILGFLCGFPIGGKVAIKLYEQNKITHRELSHLMSFCNIPSPAFICGSVGLMFSSSKFGVMLFVCLILSSVIIGISGKFFYKYERLCICEGNNEYNTASAFTAAVGSSANVMLCVCGYVVFFSVISGYLCAISQALNLPKLLSAIASGVLEISGGMNGISASGLEIAPVLAGFFAGFSSLSVFFQIISLDRGGYINKGVFFLQKLFQGVICAGLVYFALKIFPCNPDFSTPTLQEVKFSSYGLYICLLFFVSAGLPLLAGGRRR